MKNFTVEIFKTLADNLGTASYHVSERLSEKMGYTISEERASFLIARSLLRQVTIDCLVGICEFIENQDNEEFGNTVNSVLNNDVIGGDLVDA